MGSEENLVDLLNEIIEIDHDAIEAHRAAAERITAPSDRRQIVRCLEEHLRHLQDLSALVRRLGGEPSGSDGLKQILTKGKVVILGLFGDRLVLEAMKTNEIDTIAAYEAAVARRDLPRDVRAVLERSLADERRHHDWIVDRLDAAEGLLRW